MGLLDDAIREHLELKRRRGASDEEVTRQEAEALGPPRAGGQFAEPHDEAASPLDELEPVETTLEPELEEPPELDEVAPDVVEESLPDAHEDAARATEPSRPDFAGEEPWLDEPRDPHATAEFTTPDVDGEPAEEIVAADEEPRREDVLEETPDFLQETPEHDRLWFEQRPPRGFDFDK